MPNEPTYYPLVAAQEMLYFSQKYSFNKAIVNISSMTHLDCEVDAALMLQAITLGMMRNQSSAVRLHKVGKKVMQYISAQAPDPVIVMDYTGRTEEELERDLQSWSRTAFPNSSMDTQLYSVRLIKKPNGFYGVFFCVSHLAFDAYALMATASDILDIYTALRDGTAIPKAKGDYLALCQKDWDYGTSQRHEDDMKFWNEIFDTEPLFSPVDTAKMKQDKDARTGFNTNILNSKAFHVNRPLSKELADRVNGLAAQLKVSPQCCYLLAFRSYLSKIRDDQDDIILNNTVARRATLLQKRSGGTLVMALPFRMNLDNKTTSVEEALLELNRLQKLYYAHSDASIMETLGLLRDKFHNTKSMHGYTSTSLTFNPYKPATPDGIVTRTTNYCNGAATTPLYLSIMALDDSGNLNCNYECMDAFTTPDTALAVHEQLLKALDAMTANPAMKLIELNHL